MPDPDDPLSDESRREPGWYPDPFGRLRFRYWDGSAWTAYAANTEVQWDAAPVETVVEHGPGLRGLAAAAVGFVASVVLSLGIGLALWAAGRPGGRAVALAATELGLWGGLVGACVFVSHRRGTGSLRRDFEWRVQWRDVGFGFAGAIAARIVSGAVLAPIPLPFHHLRTPDRSVFNRVAHGPGGWAIVIIVTCIGAPLVEELFFRGLLQTRLVGLWGPATGIAVASVVFGAAHLLAWQGPITLAYAWSIAGAGLVLGLIRHLTGRLGPSTLAHAFFNIQAVLLIALLR